MAQKLINIGTSPNKGDGDPLRLAFEKINENFTELYTGSPIIPEDLRGSVFGDDSTLLVDGVNNLIPSSVIQGTEATNWDTAFGWGDHSTAGYADGTNEANWDTAFLWGDHSAAGYALQATTYTKVEVDAAIAAVDPLTGDVTGSVFADDSTLLVDGVNGTIPAANLSGALPAIDGSALTGVVSAFSDLTGTPTTLAGYGITDAITAGGDIEGDLSGSVFADDSTLLVDGVNGKIVGEVTGTISSINWMAASDSYLTISNGGSTGPGPIQIVASANLDLTSGSNNDINITPHGSGRVKVNDGGLGIVEAANFIGHADETMYLSSKTTGAESTHIALNSTSGVATTMYGAVDFVSGGSVDFTGSTVTGLNVTGDITGDITGSIFADDSTLLVDGVNGTIPAANLTGALPAIDGSALTGLPAGYADSDVDTHLNTGSAGSNEVLSWTGSDYAWVAQSGGGGTFALAGNTGTHTFNTATETLTFLGTTGQINAGIAANNVTLELDPNINSIVSISFEGATADNFETKLQAVDPTADRTINLPDADGTVALLSDISGGGLPTRSTATGTTSSLADAAEADLDITGFKSYALLTITTDRAARVRLYVSDATRTADASRAEGVDPTSDAGLIAEVITTGADTVIISPGAYGFNLESSPTTTIPCRVTNKSGSASTVQVDLNILQLEA